MRSLNLFSLPKPSNYTMAQGLTQPQTGMSSRKCFRGVECSQCVKLTASSLSVSQLSTSQTLLASTTCYGDNFTTFFFFLLSLHTTNQIGEEMFVPMSLPVLSSQSVG
jgi:hypothetical protein